MYPRWGRRHGEPNFQAATLLIQNQRSARKEKEFIVMEKSRPKLLDAPAVYNHHYLLVARSFQRAKC